MEESMLHCFPAFLSAREIVQHGSKQDVEIELRIASVISREDLMLINEALVNFDSATEWINISDSHGGSFRKSVINGQAVYIEKKLIAKQNFETGTDIALCITAKTEKPCDPALLGTMHFDMKRRKLRRSITYSNLRFDLTVVWTVHGDSAPLPPHYEVEVELLPVANEPFNPTVLAGQLLDAGYQLLNILQPSNTKGMSCIKAVY
jgi:hypothetical protein